jgi:hypothetical protein
MSRYLAVAMLAFLPAAAAGCAYGVPSQQSQVQQIGEQLLSAYETSTSAPGVVVQVSQTAQSGVDPFASVKGSYALWFKRQIGQANLTVQDAEGSASLVVVRAGSSFYSAATQKGLAKNRVDLITVGQRNADDLPQIQSPGMDPFQVTTLLGSLQWPDSIHSLGPVAVTDSTGRHTEYQITVDTAKLALHESETDKEWLQAMGRESHGKFVTLEVTLNAGRISVVSASLPLPSAPLPSVPSGKKSSGAKLQTPPPAAVLITAEFDYSKQVPAVANP